MKDDTFDVDRILDAFDNATRAELAQGQQWYSAAHTFSRGLSSRYDVSVPTAAAVVAVLSPRVSWAINLRNADTYLKTGHCPTFYRTLAKLERLVFDGEAPLEVLGGPKVRSFYDNIVRPTSSKAVTIDRHAFDLLTGSTDDLGRKPLERKGVYASCADAYRLAADSLGLLPHQVQATTWLTWKRTKSYSDRRHAAQFSGTGSEHLS